MNTSQSVEVVFNVSNNWGQCQKQRDMKWNVAFLVAKGGLPRWLRGKQSACPCRRGRFYP